MSAISFRMYKQRGVSPKGYTYTDLYSDFVIETKQDIASSKISYNVMLAIYETFSKLAYQSCMEGAVVRMPMGKLFLGISKQQTQYDEELGKTTLKINPKATKDNIKRFEKEGITEDPTVYFTNLFYLKWKLYRHQNDTGRCYDFTVPVEYRKARSKIVEEITYTEAKEKYVTLFQRSQFRKNV